MTRKHKTPLGTFYSGTSYRQQLISNGYKDLGWQNGWNAAQFSLWRVSKTDNELLGHKIEDLQWNDSGSDCTYVLHGNKVFCSVDMGD